MNDPSDATASDARLMSWENFRSTFLLEGLGAEIPVAGNPKVDIFVEPGGRAMGLKTPVTQGATPPRSAIDAIAVRVTGNTLRIRTTDRDLYQPFFAFLLDVSNRIQLDGKSPTNAFTDALNSWRRMLTPSSVMSEEMQTGLAGELWALERLVSAYGPTAVAAWTGPDREAHDFRLLDREIEVKTTTGEKRTHVISRLDQLAPSNGTPLYILSLQMAAAGLGPGWSLPDQVARLRELVKRNDGDSELFEQKLSSWGWRDADAPRYLIRRKLASEPAMVPVDECCPRITPTLISDGIGALAARIDDVRYRVNLEGMGVKDGHEDFLAVLPIDRR